MLALLQIRGSGVRHDRDAALGWLRKSHAQKYESSAAVLGALLVERASTAEETAEGITILREAGRKHDELALMTLARLSEMGRGVPQDLAQAVSYYEQAAAMGSKQAPIALAKLRERSAK